MHDRRRIRCAIYTRKSTEEGLEQGFNSLHAQREACEAYIVSQKHEGWSALSDSYNDGGYSGGSMERPALQALLADIAAGRVDVVVVYKVDRLTRSLADFAKMVEAFDRHTVSFVSVTQAFNTTSSMGRLTLNVLLSFAQFEREVTGERIRDKIAASKKKGMWMGGFAPLGFEAKDRTLVVNSVEAQTVRTIFRRYLELRSVDALKDDLEATDLRTKLRSGRCEQMTGGKLFSRGHLYRILSNVLYIGKIAHKGDVYDGMHEPIIDSKTWEATKACLAANNHRHLVKAHSKNPSLLSGLLVDGSGQSLIASHAVKNGKRYRYYVSRPNGPRRRVRKAANERTWRLPAAEIENAVIRILTQRLGDESWLLEHLAPTLSSLDQRKRIIDQATLLRIELTNEDPIGRRGAILALLERVRIAETEVKLTIKVSGLLPANTDAASDQRVHTASLGIEVEEPLELRRRNGELRLIIESDGPPEPEPDPALTKALGQAHRWWRDLTSGNFQTIRDVANAYDTDERYAAWILRLAFLPNHLTEAILAGKQPWDLTLHQLIAEAQ